MKKTNIGLMVLCIVLAVILLTVAICMIIANSQNDSTPPTAQLASWMSMIKDDALLKQIVIPGAHDAGTVGLPYFAETQDKNTMDLLLCGTRYLDLRIAKDKDDFKIYHGPFKGMPLDAVLSSVKQFLNNNPTETVILDFQHFNDDSAETLKGTAEKLTKTLSGKLIQKPKDEYKSDFVNSLTLGKARGKCLVVWGDGYDEVKNDYIFRRNNDAGTHQDCVIQSYYESSLNKKVSSAYVKEALPYYISRYQQDDFGLFVLQGQLTDGALIFGPHLKEATHTKRMNDFVKSLANSDDLSVINIIMRDYVTPEKNALALMLNINKNTVKTSRVADFENMVKENCPSLAQ